MFKVMNGKQLNRAWFYNDDLVKGGTLDMQFGATPNKEWASSPQDVPPSMMVMK